MPALNSLCFFSASSSLSTTNFPTRPSALNPSKSSSSPPHPDISLHLPDIPIPTHIKEKILSLEILNSDLRDASLDSVRSLISYLQSKGIRQKDFPRIFAVSPKILTSSIPHTLAPVFAFLSKDLRVPSSNFRRVVNKCPKVLVSSVRDQLKPALLYLNYHIIG